MILKLCILRSGSHANCTAIWAGNEALLIDCAKFESEPDEDRYEVTDELHSIDVNPSMIKGLLVSHAHGDHIDDNALHFAMRHGIFIYSHPDTFSRIKKKFPRIDHDESMYKDISKGKVKIGCFKVESFKTDHWADKKFIAGQSIGFVITFTDKKNYHKIGYVTDTKAITTKMHSLLKDCQTLIIESNFSEDYIKTIDPHPGYEEHLGNQATGKAIAKIHAKSKDKDALKNVILAHISDSNNTVKRALKEVRKVLESNDLDIELHPTYRHKRTEIHELKQFALNDKVIKTVEDKEMKSPLIRNRDRVY